MTLNPWELPAYLGVPLLAAYLVAWVFVGLVWVGFYNNCVVRTLGLGAWERLDGEAMFLNALLWPAFAALVLTIATVFGVLWLLSSCIYRAWLALCCFLDWVEGR